MKKFYFTLLAITLMLFSTAFCGDFKSNVEKLMGSNAKLYTMPLIEGFGSSLNAGVYKKASVSTGKLIPIGFDIGVATIVTTVPDDQTEFTPNLEDFSFNFNLSSQNEDLEDLELTFADIFASADKTPNIAGSGDGATFSLKSEDEIYENLTQKLLDANVSQNDIDDNENDIRNFITENLENNNDFRSFSFPKGLGVQTLGAFALQANVRLPLIGLELSGRYLPTLKINEDIGEFSMYGLGLRKSLPVPIIDVTAGLFLQKLEIGNLFELNTRLFHIEAGKSIGVPFLFSFSPYAGVGFAQTEATLSYTIQSGDIPGMEEDKNLKYNIEADDNIIYTLGVTAQVIPLTYLNFELNQSDYTTYCLKFGLILK